MSETLHEQATRIAAGEIARRRGVLHGLDSDERAELERLAFSVAAGVADCLLELARRDSRYAAALGGVPRG